MNREELTFKGLVSSEATGPVALPEPTVPPSTPIDLRAIRERAGQPFKSVLTDFLNKMGLTIMPPLSGGQQTMTSEENGLILGLETVHAVRARFQELREAVKDLLALEREDLLDGQWIRHTQEWERLKQLAGE